MVVQWTTCEECGDPVVVDPVREPLCQQCRDKRHEHAAERSLSAFYGGSTASEAQRMADAQRLK